MRKIGINLHSVKGCSDSEAVELLASHGFEATFSDTYSAERQVEIAELLAKKGISYDTLHAPFDRINDMWREGEDGERMCERLIAAVDNCALAGVPTAIVHLSSGVHAPQINDVGIARFTRLVEHAEKKGVVVAFENQRKLANISWALETFEANAHVGFCWDCGHEGCFSPGREYMPLFSSQLVALHIHDNFAVFNEDRHMLPFDASLDFERIARQIRTSGYGGTLMLEVFKKDGEPYGNMSADEYLSRAYAAATALRKMTDND